MIKLLMSTIYCLSSDELTQ